MSPTDVLKLFTMYVSQNAGTMQKYQHCVYFVFQSPSCKICLQNFTWKVTWKKTFWKMQNLIESNSCNKTAVTKSSNTSWWCIYITRWHTSDPRDAKQENSLWRAVSKSDVNLIPTCGSETYTTFLHCRAHPLVHPTDPVLIPTKCVYLNKQD